MDRKTWLESYRVETLHDMVGQEAIVGQLREMVTKSQRPPPCMLFYGPPGVGKTSCVVALAKAMRCPQFLEVNASLERNAESIFMRLNEFIDTAHGDWSMILLDEADEMTIGAMELIHTYMEQHATRVCFAMTCNNVALMIPPLRSRCLLFPMYPLTTEHVAERLRAIATSEHVPIRQDALLALARHADGDMRQAIATLEMCDAIRKKRQPITVKMVASVQTGVSDKDGARIVALCAHGMLDHAIALCTHLFECGYTASDVVEAMTKVVTEQPLSPAFGKTTSLSSVSLQHEYTQCVLLYHSRLQSNFSGHSAIQMHSLLATMCRLSTH